jgi:ADP-ribose pyrophosphatase YjhB (NUDIX family)
MDLRLAVYVVCTEDERVLVAHAVKPDGEKTWTLPGGRVEHAEDPFAAAIREVAEETGLEAEIERRPGMDSRVVPAAERRLARSARAPQCLDLLRGAHHRRPASARTERRDRRIGLDPDPKVARLILRVLKNLSTSYGQHG